MKTHKEYASEYRKIADNLGFQGDSVEMLVQMLAHFTYTNEVENIAYALEGSLERATQTGSKIQLCVEQMYSVFRGQNPRVYLKIRPTKFFEFALYDKVYSGNSFSLYYLGYGDSIDSITSAPVTLAPGVQDYIILECLLAREIHTGSWTTSANNLYYVDLGYEGLSSDIWVKIGQVGNDNLDYIKTTRIFQEHLLEEKVFDLTLPGWSLRLYLPESLRAENTVIKAGAFGYVSVDDFSAGDYKNIRMTGAELVSFVNLPMGYTESSKGILVIPEKPREDMGTIHYKANQDRFMGGILRSNSDVGNLLKEMFPEKIKDTSYRYQSTPGITKTTLTDTVLEGELLADTILSYESPVTGEEVPHLEFSVPEAATSIVLKVAETSSEVPGTTVYRVATESPVSKEGQPMGAYVIKTYLSGDDIIQAVVTDLEAEGITMSYSYGNTENWVDTTGLIPSRPAAETEPLMIRVYSGGTLDQESVPLIGQDTTYFGLVDKNYTVPLNARLEAYKVWPVTIPTVLFVKGAERVADSYSILNASRELDISVSDTGVVTLRGLKSGSVGPFTAIISATIGSLVYTSTLTVTTTATPKSLPRILQVWEGAELLQSTPVLAGDVVSLPVKPGSVLGLGVASLPDESGISKIILGGVDIQSDIINEEIIPGNFKPTVDIYYIPSDPARLLSDKEIAGFLESRRSYYITDEVNIQRGSLYSVSLDINLLLYQSAVVEQNISGIIGKYTNKFGINYKTLLDDLRVSIEKLPEVAKVRNIKVTCRSESGETVDSLESLDSRYCYLDIISFISTEIL